MRKYIGLTLGIIFVMGAAFAQTTPKTFEVASVKPAAPLDPQKMAADMAAGKTPKVGMHVDPGRVEFIYTDLKTLVSIAYKLKPYQVTGPDWLGSQRFDIMATFPAGATRKDIPDMLQALLKERLKLDAHLENKEHPVLALVVAKGGPKLTESSEVPADIDDSVPLKEGEMQMDSPDGPMRIQVDQKTGAGSMNMGAKGKMNFSVDRPSGATTPADMANMYIHLDAHQMTMAGLVEIMAQFSSQMGGGNGRQVVDMTGLKGHYEVKLDISLGDIMSMARASGMDMPGMPGGAAGSAPEPTGASSLFGSVQALGLRIENRKAVVDQLVVDRVEKTPTEN